MAVTEAGVGHAFRVSVDRRGDQVVVAVTGELDGATAPVLAAELDRLCDDGETRVVVDLSSAPFVDSSGLGTLVRAHKRLVRGGGELRLAAPRPNVAYVLDLSGLDRVLPIDATPAS